MKNILKKFYFLLILVLISSVFLFLNLENRFLWGDEALLGFFGKTILNYGYPSNFDGKNVIYSDPDGKIPEVFNKPGSYVWRWQPWLMFYIMAFSINIFGSTTWSIRLFPAIFGLATVITMYFFTLKLTNNKTIANLATLLLVFFVPFYLYSRTGTYYSLSIFLSLIVLYSYLKLLNKERYSIIIFIISNILLFYTTYFPFLSIYLGIILHYIIFHRKIGLGKPLIVSSLVIVIFTLPWYIYANLGSKMQISLLSILFGFFYLFIYYSLYIFPIIFWIFIPTILFRKTNKKTIIQDKYFLLLFVIILGLCIINFAPYTLPQFRYMIFLIPLSLILLAEIFLLIKKYNKYIFALVLLIFIFTNIIYLFPMKLFEPILLNMVEKESPNYYFIKENLRYRFYLIEYSNEITHEYITPNQRIIDYLNANSNTGDVYLSNDLDTVALFYTNLTKYREDLNKSPDWIIPRRYNDYLDYNNDPGYQFVIKMINASIYEKVILNYTDYPYLLDEPLPRMHRFKYNEKNEILHRFETYPIVIYHLKE